MSESDLVVNAQQLASIVGNIKYDVPAGGMQGYITADAKDVASGKTEFVGESEVSWLVSSGGSMAAISATSTASLASGPLYAVVGGVDYGRNKYLVSVEDKTSNFLVNATGGYGGNGYNW